MTLKDEPRLLTRDETAEILGVSVQEVKRKQAAKQLRVAKRASKNTVLYNYDEVMAMKMRRDDNRAAVTGIVAGAMSYTAEEAQTVCAELRKGASVLDCLDRLVIHPAKIQSIQIMYERMAGCLVLDVDTLKAINELPLDGTFPVTKASDVLTLLTKSVTGKPCTFCYRKPGIMCSGCAIPYVRKKLIKEQEKETKAAQEAAVENDLDENDLDEGSPYA